jgi:acetoin utilization deacetylase AcuC-like enzyme
MPRVGYVYDPLLLEHDMPGHPESAGRLRAIVAYLESAGVLSALERIEPRDATRDDLLLIHSDEVVQRVAQAASMGGDHWLDVDTYVVNRSYDAGVRSAGSTLAAVDAVLGGDLDSAFCLMRPPGHHATPTRSMGFCLFNNVAIAAAHALERKGVERVSIVDFDVHHGNGTQDAFYAEPRVQYFSTHQFPFYPGTGNWDDTGHTEAMGNTINVPLPGGCGDTEYFAVYSEICVPALLRFKPDLVLVSAGFDAHFADPLAMERVSTHGYYQIASMLKRVAVELCEGRIVFVLEGGYDLTALSWSVQACLDALMGKPFRPDPLGEGPQVRGPDVSTLLAKVKELHGL